jgi:hypothetical protein
MFIMKKLLMLSVFFSGFFIAGMTHAGGPEVLIEAPDYFSGFYVGGTGAFHMTAFNGFSSVDTPNPVEFNETFTPAGTISTTLAINQIFFPAGNLMNGDVDSSSFDAFYGVHGGVGKVFAHRWYTGFEGFGEWATRSEQTTVSSNANFASQSQVTVSSPAGSFTETVPVTGSLHSDTSVKLSNDYGFAFRPGFLVAPRTLVYGKVGAVWANLQVSNDISGVSTASINNTATGLNYQSLAVIGGTSSNTENKISLLLGLGLEQFIYKNFITLGVEYNYANYGHVSTQTSIRADEGVSAALTNGDSVVNVNGNNSVPNVGTTQASVDARVSTLLGTLNFYFGSHWF